MADEGAAVGDHAVHLPVKAAVLLGIAGEVRDVVRGLVRAVHHARHLALLHDHGLHVDLPVEQADAAHGAIIDVHAAADPPPSPLILFVQQLELHPRFDLVLRLDGARLPLHCDEHRNALNAHLISLSSARSAKFFPADSQLDGAELQLPGADVCALSVIGRAVGIPLQSKTSVSKGDSPLSILLPSARPSSNVPVDISSLLSLSEATLSGISSHANSIIGDFRSQLPHTPLDPVPTLLSVIEIEFLILKDFNLFTSSLFL